ncbi:MAG: DUF4337 domain-containing protein [Verrucomicrobiota bacterium]
MPVAEMQLENETIAKKFLFKNGASWLVVWIRLDFGFAKRGRDCFHSGMESNDSTTDESLNNLVAVTLAILAAFMAVSNVKDNNICQAMVKEKADEVNRWSNYQSKSIKQNLAELGRAELAGLASTTTGDTRAKLDAKVKWYDEEIARYENEKTEIKLKAEQHGKNYDALNFRDDQFDVSDATLSLSLAMLAVTALTKKRWLLIASWVLGGFGALIGIAGFIGLNLHPDWLIKLLS